MISNYIFARCLLIGLLFLSVGLLEAPAQSGIYVGGYFRRNRTQTVNALKTSGFTYVILFDVTVEANGDLTTDGDTVCTNGSYVYGRSNPEYVSDVKSLKMGTTSINRLETCIGGAGDHSYANIRTLIRKQGAGTTSILYRNFKALKDALPFVDAINNDDEETYDVSSATTFHVMLADIGYRTTLAPYTNHFYWEKLATSVNQQRSGAVDKVYLQHYSGGAGNNPCDWNLNAIELHTGDLYYENPATVANKMISARDNCRSKGGFFWVYNQATDLKKLATLINTIFPAATVTATLAAAKPSELKAYPNPAHDQVSISLPPGTETVGIAVHNTLGQLLRTLPAQHPTATGEVIISVGELNTGLYLVEVYNQRYRGTFRLVLE